jgi:hypothetical protein
MIHSKIDTLFTETAFVFGMSGFGDANSPKKHLAHVLEELQHRACIGICEQ